MAPAPALTRDTPQPLAGSVKNVPLEIAADNGVALDRQCRPVDGFDNRLKIVLGYDVIIVKFQVAFAPKLP